MAENENKAVSTFAKVSEAFPEYKGKEELLSVIWRNVAKNTNIQEFQYFIGVCKEHGLSPFKKEIWCYKDHRGNLIIFAGRDGLLAKAQNHPRWNGIRSSEVYEKDIFAMDIANNKISHSPEYGKDRGKLIGAYAIVFLKDGEPTITWADYDTHKGSVKSAWGGYPAAMIKKVAEHHALKRCFGFSNLQSEDEWTIKNGVATPNNQTIEIETNEDVESIRVQEEINSCQTKEELVVLWQAYEAQGLEERIADLNDWFLDREMELEGQKS